MTRCQKPVLEFIMVKRDDQGPSTGNARSHHDGISVQVALSPSCHRRQRGRMARARPCCSHWAAVPESCPSCLKHRQGSHLHQEPVQGTQRPQHHGVHQNTPHTNIPISSHRPQSSHECPGPCCFPRYLPDAAHSCTPPAGCQEGRHSTKLVALETLIHAEDPVDCSSGLLAKMKDLLL